VQCCILFCRTVFDAASLPVTDFAFGFKAFLSGLTIALGVSREVLAQPRRSSQTAPGKLSA
jgi:hypothetical protein